MKLVLFAFLLSLFAGAEDCAPDGAADGDRSGHWLAGALPFAVVEPQGKKVGDNQQVPADFSEAYAKTLSQYEEVSSQLQSSQKLRRIIMVLAGITLVLFVYSFRKYRSYKILNRELLDKQQKLTDAYAEVAASHKKYHSQYERMRQLLEAISDGTWEMDLGTQEIFLGKGFVSLLGYQPDIKDLSDFGKNSNLIHPQDYPRLKEAISGCISGESVDLSLEVRVLDDQKVYRWLQLRGRVIKPADEDEPRRMFGIVYDIEVLKKAKADTLKKELELQEANKAKDKFFSIIAHDLKSPFNAILGLSELLAKEFESFEKEELREFADNIYTAADSAYQLLQNLLQWSRSQNGRIEFEPAEYNLGDLVAEVVKVNQHHAENKKITIYTEVPENIRIVADKNMLHTILHNLLSNAIKFTPDHKSVKITAQQRSDATEVHVVDEGVGIPGEHTRRLFNIDNDYRRPGTNHEKGTGLGLILCKEFTDKHNGQIWVDSKTGRGSDFGFTLPHNLRRG